MNLCPRCNRHVRGSLCPRCGTVRALAKIASLVAAGGVVSTLAACYGGAPVPQPTTAQPPASASDSSAPVANPAPKP